MNISPIITWSLYIILPNDINIPLLTVTCSVFIETNHTKFKTRNISIRVAASSTDLKRSFFENNMCALNFLSPDKRRKVKKKENIMTKPQSTDREPHIFEEVANQPEAKKWTEQQVGHQMLNQSLGISAEYDGDVFLPSGILIVIKLCNLNHDAFLSDLY